MVHGRFVLNIKTCTVSAKFGNVGSANKERNFVSIWSDGRFPPPTAPITCTPAGVCSRPRNDSATPDSFFEIFGDGTRHGDDGSGAHRGGN